MEERKKAFSYSHTQSHVINTQHENKIRFLCEHGRMTRKFQTFMLIKDPFCHLRVFRRVQVTHPQEGNACWSFRSCAMNNLRCLLPSGSFFSSVSVLLKTAVTDAFRKYLDFMLILELLQSFFLYSSSQNDDRIKTSCTIIALWFLNRLNLVYGLRC